MVIGNTLKTKILSSLAIVLLTLLMITPCFLEYQSFAVANCNTSNGTTTCSDSTIFNVRVNEILTVAITRPETWASGQLNVLLKNKIGISVTSNNAAGFTATMKTSDANAELVNTTDSASVIPTLSSNVSLDDTNDSTHKFPANRWGYNIVNKNASIPTTYYPVIGSGGTPTTIAYTNTASPAVSKDIYFAAKANNGIASGTYKGSVVISVVSGIIDEDNPVTPVDPITPGNTDGTRDVASGGQTYSVTTTTDGNTTTTSSYAKPAGVTTSTTATINEGTPLATGLAVTAGIAATAGIIFFIIAKRRRDEEEDDGTEEY